MSSLGKIHYGLRPAKNMERKMFCEAFARLSRIAPLPTYRYVGFGSTEFCDFRLFHERLGIKDMLSIESQGDARARVEFNRPYSCIEMKWGLSHVVLPTLHWTQRTIVWLDYDSPLKADKLGDIALMAGKAPSGSVLVVTVPVSPGNANEAKDRLSELTHRVGANRIRPSLHAKDLSKWGMAKACRDIVHDEILKALNDRGAPHSPDERIRYQQLFNFHYEDGAKMLTVGGIFLDREDGAKLSTDEDFQDLEFICLGEPPYYIERPVLTWREMRLLDKKLPASAKSPDWIPEEEREKYRKVYRYYPNFTEVEA